MGTLSLSLDVVPGSSASAFLPSTVDEVLDRACRAVGLDPAEAVLLRLGENMLYQLAAPVVVRIARDMGHWDDALKEVATAKWLADEGFPAAQIYDIGQQQPIEIGGHPVTFWRFIPGRAAELAEVGILGQLLRRLHQLERPAGLALPPVQAFAHVTARLDTAPIPAADADFLRHRVRELEQELRTLAFGLPSTALHGDAHVKNVMISGDGGQAVLIDLEAFAFGPAEWDLAKTAAETSMGMLAERDYAAFTDSYGYDVTTWSGWPVLQAIQQVKMITWLSQNVDHSPRVRAEYDKRIRTLRTGRLTEAWCGQ